jgi:CheY-like chemotaxis protein
MAHLIEQQTIELPVTGLTKTKDNTIHILMVDDDVGFLRVAAQIIGDEQNFDVQAANSVDAALKLVDTQPFDIIISDYDMPHIDGLEFLRILRNNKNDIPFLFFTGKG